LNEVYPNLNSNIKIDIAGKGAQQYVKNFSNIKYHGFVKSSFEFISSCKVFIIPSVSGGGVQIKTLEAISTGVSIIATDLAVRGLGEMPSNVSVTNGAIEFARKIEEKISLSESCEDYEEWTKARSENFINQVRNCVDHIDAN